MPFNEALFWVGITVFGTGLYFVTDRVSKAVTWFSAFVTICGIVAMGYAMYAHNHQSTPLPALWVYFLALTWVLVGLDIRARRRGRPTYLDSSTGLVGSQRALIEIADDKSQAKITPEELIALFNRGETTMDGQRLVAPYIGLTMYVSGEIRDITAASISFKGRGSHNRNGVSSYFPAGTREKLLHLRPGYTVKIMGTLEAVSAWDIRLDDCDVISTTNP